MDTKTLTERVAENFIAGKTPEALKKHQFTKNDPDNPNPKGSDKDGDGKTNEKKPDFIKDKKSSDVPRGVVAALSAEGRIAIFAANNAEAADGIKTALMECEGEYSAIAHGPNEDQLTVNELYAHFEERWAGKIPPQFLKNIKKKKDDAKGDDKDDAKGDKKDDKKGKGGLPPWLEKGKGDKKDDKKKAGECGCDDDDDDEDGKKASREVTAAKEVTAAGGVQYLLAKYDAVGGYSMSDMSSSRGIRAKVWIERSRDGEDYAIDIDGVWHNIWSNHMSGKDGKEENSFKLHTSFRARELTNGGKLADFIEKEIQKIVDAD